MSAIFEEDPDMICSRLVSAWIFENQDCWNGTSVCLKPTYANSKYSFGILVRGVPYEVGAVERPGGAKKLTYESVEELYKDWSIYDVRV